MIPFRIGVITVPIFKSGNHPLENLLNILLIHSEKVYLITGNDGYVFFRNDSRFIVDGWIYKDGKPSIGLRIFRYFWTQMVISIKLFKQRKNTDIWIFFFGAYRLTVPILIAKILKKKVVLLLPDSFGRVSLIPQNFISILQIMLLKINYSCSNLIVVYSSRFISEWGLKPYSRKILTGHEHFIDTHLFDILIPYNKRTPVIGFIGRFSREKGILEFLQIIPDLLEKNTELNVILCGDGPLFENITSYLKDLNLIPRVTITGWIEHEKLPLVLNQLKLLVVPSYTEGLPNIVLEAMACGTPVLATSVGAIPDIIQDGQTGLIMENNSPECLIKNVLRALDYPNVNQIIKDGRQLVQNAFTFEKTSESWRVILQNIQEDT